MRPSPSPSRLLVQTQAVHLYSPSRDDLFAVIDAFLYHAKDLPAPRQGWLGTMRVFLRSVNEIVGPHAILPADSCSTSASVPTAFLHELESLRESVDTAKEEVIAISAGSREVVKDIRADTGRRLRNEEPKRCPKIRQPS